MLFYNALPFKQKLCVYFSKQTEMNVSKNTSESHLLRWLDTCCLLLCFRAFLFPPPTSMLHLFREGGANDVTCSRLGGGGEGSQGSSVGKLSVEAASLLDFHLMA